MSKGVGRLTPLFDVLRFVRAASADLPWAVHLLPNNLEFMTDALEEDYDFTSVTLSSGFKIVLSQPFGVDEVREGNVVGVRRGECTRAVWPKNC
jgi:hypothetical protein